MAEIVLTMGVWCVHLYSVAICQSYFLDLIIEPGILPLKVELLLAFMMYSIVEEVRVITEYSYALYLCLLICVTLTK